MHDRVRDQKEEGRGVFQMIRLNHKGGVQEGPKTDHEILEQPLRGCPGG